MTKKQLVKWLEAKKVEAINETNKQFTVRMDEYIIKRNELMKLDETAQKVAELISKADDIINDWRTDIQTSCGVNIYVDFYNNIRNRLSDIVTPSGVKGRMLHEFVDHTAERKAIENKKEETFDAINVNYFNVIANVQNLKDAKAGVAYLQELGFDLTDLLEADKNPVTTALSTQIDTRYLFIKAGE